MMLLIIFSVIAFVAAIVLTFATEKKTVTIAYYTMAMAIGFTTMPLIDDVSVSAWWVVGVDSIVGHSAHFTGAWLYAYKNQNDPRCWVWQVLPLACSLVHAFVLLPAQIPAAMMLYSAIAIVVFSLYLACDLAWAIQIGRDGHSGGDDVLPIKMGATIFLDLVNIFKDMLLLIVAIQSGKDMKVNPMTSLLKVLGVIAMVVVLPIALIWYCVNRDTDSNVYAPANGRQFVGSRGLKTGTGADPVAGEPSRCR